MNIDMAHLLKIQREFEGQKKKHPEMRERHCPVSLFGKILGEAFEAHRLRAALPEARTQSRREALEEARTIARKAAEEELDLAYETPPRSERRSPEVADDIGNRINRLIEIDEAKARGEGA